MWKVVAEHQKSEQLLDTRLAVKPKSNPEFWSEEDIFLNLRQLPSSVETMNYLEKTIRG